MLNGKRSFLVVGLESSCTRYVSRLIALNLEIIQDFNDWDGHFEVENEHYVVIHRSLPHGDRHNFIESWREYDYVIICTRDIHCVTQSKQTWHQPIKYLAEQENDQGMIIMRKLLSERKCYLFSYETAWILRDVYIEGILLALGIKYSYKIPLHDINHKYYDNKLKADTSHLKTVLKAIILILSKLNKGL
jgi:hypothetical protein